VLPQHSAGVRNIFERLLSERCVEVITSCKVERSDAEQLYCAGGRAVGYDEAVFCTQGGAQEWLRETGLALDPDGFIAVEPTLESTNTPGVFACGDVAAVLAHPRPKAGVFAVRQGPPLTANLRAVLRGERPAPFAPQTQFLGLISCGDGQCVASRGRLALKAAWLWPLKDHIDRFWMHQYTEGLPRMAEEPAAGSRGGATPSAVAASVTLNRPSPTPCSPGPQPYPLGGSAALDTEINV